MIPTFSVMVECLLTFVSVHSYHLYNRVNRAPNVGALLADSMYVLARLFDGDGHPRCYTHAIEVAEATPRFSEDRSLPDI